MLRQPNKLGRNRVWLQMSILLNFIGERYKIFPTVDLNRSHQSFTDTTESFKKIAFRVSEMRMLDFIFMRDII
jgi:hypothetical protein